MKKLLTIFLLGISVMALSQNDIEKVKKLAEQGDADAQFKLGEMYIDGKSVAENKEKAFYWWKKSAEQGVSDAFFNIGKMYFLGEGTQKNIEKGLYWLKKGAEQGDGLAQSMLGYIYLNGFGNVEMNIQKGVYWYEKYAEQDDRDNVAEFQFKLALLYSQNKQVLNKNKSIYWLKKSAENGYAKGQYYLAVAYFQGDGVPFDKSKGIIWLVKAYGNGSEDAKKLLDEWKNDNNKPFLEKYKNAVKNHEKIFYNGMWWLCDENEAIYYRIYEKYDEKDRTWLIKSYYIDGTIQWIGKVKNNNITATNCDTALCDDVVTWYDEQGNKKYSVLYKNGKNVKIIYDNKLEGEAKKLAEQGDIEAQLFLGVEMLKAKNYKKGAYWIKKAKEQGDEDAKKLWNEYELWKYNE